MSATNTTKAGFIATIGRPNAGKSTLLNTLSGHELALVSHKANATRKRMQFIIQHDNTQLIFIDTPGLHQREQLLHRFMLQESLSAMGDCDIVLFVAPLLDDTSKYEEFLNYNHHLAQPKKHIVLLSKIDCATHTQIADKLKSYEAYKSEFEAIIPLSCKSQKDKKLQNFTPLLDTLSRLMPPSPFLYDSELLTTSNTREITKELIREALFENLSEEIPYSCEVIIKSFKENPKICSINATIIVEKESQKAMVIGKGASCIKRIGKAARAKIQEFVENNVYLGLEVNVLKNWSKDKEKLKTVGYDFLEEH